MVTAVPSSDQNAHPSRLWGLVAAVGFGWVVSYAVNGSLWDCVVMSTPALVIDGEVNGNRPRAVGTRTHRPAYRSRCLT